VEYTIIVPKYIHVLNPQTCDYAAVLGKKNFAEMTKPGLLRWGDYPRLAQSNPSVLTRERQVGEDQRGDMTMKRFCSDAL
jgi:hypothetical protein